MRTHRLGSSGPRVSMLALGCMGMSDLYGPADRTEAIATIHAALDAGVNLLDTGDFYGMGHNEMLICEALRGRPRDETVISVKFGALRDLSGNFAGVDTRPVAIRNFLTYTLRRLGTDHVDIYQSARLDPNVPIEETVGAMADLVKAGHVRHIGFPRSAPRLCGVPRRCTPFATCKSNMLSSRAASRPRSFQPAASSESGSRPMACWRAA